MTMVYDGFVVWTVPAIHYKKINKLEQNTEKLYD